MIWKYIIVSTIQGVVEWIPISSEGVSTLVAQFLNIKDPLDLALFLHLGTAGAALFFFWKDWKKVLTFKDKDLLKFLVIATIVSLMVGFPIYKGLDGFIENLNPKITGQYLLLITGVGLLFTAFFQKKQRGTSLLSGNKLPALAGFLQGLAALPGFSRSGSTIFGLSLGGFKPSKTLKISYMMLVPVSLSSSIYILIFENNTFFSLEALISLVVSFTVGWFSLQFLIDFSKKISFFGFALTFSILCFIGFLIPFLL